MDLGASVALCASCSAAGLAASSCRNPVSNRALGVPDPRPWLQSPASRREHTMRAQIVGLVQSGPTKPRCDALNASLVVHRVYGPANAALDDSHAVPRQ